jgi:hypothetical protein
MKNLKFSALLILVVAFAAACGGGSKPAAQKGMKKVSSGPDWFMSESDNENFLFAYATSTSTRQETARQKAMTNASAEMARKLSVKVEALQKMFNEEITSGSQTNYDEAFTNASKTIASEKLTGLAQHKVEFYQNEAGEFQCYIAVKLPVGDARARLENTLSKNQEMWVKFKESKAFDELQKDIQRVGGN